MHFLDPNMTGGEPSDIICALICVTSSSAGWDVRLQELGFRSLIPKLL